MPPWWVPLQQRRERKAKLSCGHVIVTALLQVGDRCYTCPGCPPFKYRPRKPMTLPTVVAIKERKLPGGLRDMFSESGRTWPLSLLPNGSTPGPGRWRSGGDIADSDQVAEDPS